MIGLWIGGTLAVISVVWIVWLAILEAFEQSPDAHETASERRRRSAGVSEQDRHAHRTAYLRSLEDGVCVCPYHGRLWCAVHSSEGETVGGEA